MKKRFLLLVSCLVILFALAACNNGTQSQTKGSEDEFADHAFINELSNALQERFDEAEKPVPGTFGETAYDQHFETLIDIEITALSEYRNKKFEDPELQKYVISYLDNLQKAKDAVSDAKIDAIDASTKYDETYNARSKLLLIFVNDYGLKVDAKHSAILDDLVSRGNSVIKKDKVKETVETVLCNVKFEAVPESNAGKWKTYRAVLENTSGYDLEYVTYNIDLMDENGVVLEQNFTSLSYVTNGKTYNMEFSTDVNFFNYEYTVEYSIAD